MQVTVKNVAPNSLLEAGKAEGSDLAAHFKSGPVLSKAGGI